LATPKKSAKTTSTKGDRSTQPVAPASWKVLGGVVFLCTVGLLVSAVLPSDILAIAGCVVTLTVGALVLDVHGRRRAAAHPHPLYEPVRLPSDSPKLKVAVMVMTLMALVAVISLTVGPNRQPSPFPFFVAAEWIFLVLPQGLARRAVRRYDEGHGADVDGAEASPAPSTAQPAPKKTRKRSKK
jgi:hypothetical protein